MLLKLRKQSKDDIREAEPLEASEEIPSVESTAAPSVRHKTTAQIARGLVIKLALIILTTVVMLTCVLAITIQYGNNMFPAVRDGDLIISYRLSNPSINAAVLYRHDGKVRVGRIVALEGHTVDITDQGAITVNGIAPAEEVFYPTFKADGSEVSYPYTVGANKVFVLNDFRDDTNDSRSFGAIDTSELMGSLLLTVRRRGF